MKISIVSDIHGNVEGLRRVACEAEFLVVLGDLLDYVDYEDPAGGILGQLFDEQRVQQFIELRGRGDFAALHAYDQLLWSTVPDPQGTLQQIVAEQYAAIARSLGPHVLVTLGNVDLRELWDHVVPERLRCLDGDVVRLDGLSFGFVGGGAVDDLPTGSPWTSFDRPRQQFRDQVAALGPVDVLCTHVPPDLDDVRFDTITGRAEMYGPGLLEYIDQQQPKRAFFGHVHHPRARLVVRGATTCVNVGYFRRHPEAHVFDTRAV